MFKWFSNLSLTLKLSVSIFISLSLGMAGIGSFIFMHSEETMETQILEAGNNSIKGTIAYIGETVSNAEQAVQTLKNTISRFETEEEIDVPTLLQSTLEALNNEGEPFIGVWMFTNPDKNHPTGYLYYAYKKYGKNNITTEAGAPLYQDREWYQGALRDGKLHWGEPYIDEEEIEKPLVTTASIPFKFKGSDKWDGVISVSFDLKEIQDKISRTRFYKSGQLLLLSKAGLYMVHPDPQIQFKKTIFDLASDRNLPELRETGERLANGETGVVQMNHSSVFGSSVIYFFAPVPGPDWGVCLVFSQTEFFKPLHQMTQWVLLASLIGLIALLTLVGYICHKSTAPLTLLSKAATEFGAGHFDAKLPDIHSSDEIGIMSDAFHKMRDSLVLHIEQEKKEVAEKERRESELEIARQIQTSALPTNFATTTIEKTYDVFALMNAAKEVGGDFYDFFMTDETHLAVLIADVSGKGVPASLFMMKAKTLIKNKTQSGLTPDKVFTEVNKELCQNNDAQMFVTAFMAILDTKTGQLSCVNAGHNPPLFKGISDKYEYLRIKHSLALGMMDGIFYTQQNVTMHCNDRLLLYTDGVTEAQNVSAQFYGDERLKEVLDKSSGSMEDVLHYIRSDVDTFAKGAEQADDITMLGLCYLGTPKSILKIDANLDNLPSVMDFLEKQMKEAKATKTQINKLLLAGEEIFVNIAHYAYQGKKGNAQIEFYQGKKSLVIRFRDCGVPFNPLLKEDPNIKQDAQFRKIGGLGIFLVKKSMDKVDYQNDNGENILTIQMKLQ